MAGLEALHNADDVDLTQITEDLIRVDAALDGAQKAISDVLAVANPDGDAGDEEPALTDESGAVVEGGESDAATRDADWLWLQKAKSAARA